MIRNVSHRMRDSGRLSRWELTKNKPLLILRSRGSCGHKTAACCICTATLTCRGQKRNTQVLQWAENQSKIRDTTKTFPVLAHHLQQSLNVFIIYETHRVTSFFSHVNFIGFTWQSKHQSGQSFRSGSYSTCIRREMFRRQSVRLLAQSLFFFFNSTR